MIGFFDSGFGGLKTMKCFHDLYPDYDYIFLADNKNCPFGGKSGEEIEEITFNSLNWLFNNGVKIVIIACNTAAAYSIRKRQTLYPEKKTLSITVPGVEEIIQKKNLDIDQFSSIGVLATQATIKSNIYRDLYSRLGGKGIPNFNFVMAPDLVDMVEMGIQDPVKVKSTILRYLSQFNKKISTLILGCTHFSVYKKFFEEVFDGIIIDPSFYSAQKFGSYLQRHIEIETKLSKNATVSFYTTGDTVSFDNIGSKIFNKNIESKKVLI